MSSFDSPWEPEVKYADSSNWNERSGFDNTYTYPTDTRGWKDVSGSGDWLWTGGGEQPIGNPWSNTNASRMGSRITGSQIDADWNAMNPQWRSQLTSMGFNPGAYAEANGGLAGGNTLDNLKEWTRVTNENRQRMGGGFDNPFGGLMQMYGDLGPFIQAAGLAYGGFGGGLESLFGGGGGLPGEFMGPAMENGLMSPSMFGPEISSWTGGIDGTAGGLGNILGDTNFWSGADSLTGGQFSPNALDSVTNMSSGLDTLGMSGGNGITVDSALNPMNSLDPSVSSLAPTDASAMMETADLAPTSSDSLGQGLRPDASDPFGIKKPSYSWENKDFLTGKNGTGMEVSNADFASNPIYNTNLSNASPVDVTSGAASPFTQGLSNNNLPDIFKKLTTPVGGKMNKFGLQSLFQAPTPLGMLGKVGGALMDMNSNRDAMKLYEDAMRKSGAMGDSNAARGAFANSEWQRIQSDPNYGNEDFMNGSGRDFVNQARAAASKNGSRGSYLNSGKMLSDLYSMRLKDRNARAESVRGGFASDPYSGSTSLTPGYASLVKNQYAPIGQAISNIDRMYSLSDMFGGA